MKRIVVDIDETLFRGASPPHYQDAKPIPERIALVNKLYGLGHRIIIATGRGTGTGIDCSQVTREQLRSAGVRYDELRFEQILGADLIINDRAFQPEMLAQLVEELSK